LNFNSLLRGLDRDKDRLMRQVLLAIMKALEEKAIEGYMRAHPGRHLSIILCLIIELEVKKLLDFIGLGFYYRQWIFPFSLF
jgi:hypothetical protein